jgi:hypothetical protein
MPAKEHRTLYERAVIGDTRRNLRSATGPSACRGLSSPTVRRVRSCSRTGCGRPAVATLTYVYSDSTAVVGPLATFAEPHSYDLCEEHAVRLTVPRGWDVLRHAGEFPSPIPQADDLEALADAVREAARVDQLPHPPAAFSAATAHVRPAGRGGSRGHLHVVPPPR